MKEAVLASLVAVLVIVGFGAGYFYLTSGGTNTAGSMKSVASGGPAVIVESAINSSSAFSPREFWENSSAMNTLRSKVMSQPQFMELAQNRSYFDAGYSCSLVNGTQFTVDFEYSDTAHPFHVCGNSTAYPNYYIDAKIYLLPSGYDLSKTAYSTRYYDSQNLTVSCTTTT
jgi:hypothetical protein